MVLSDEEKTILETIDHSRSCFDSLCIIFKSDIVGVNSIPVKRQQIGGYLYIVICSLG